MDVKTLADVRRYLEAETEKLSHEANEQEIHNELDALRIRAIYAEHAARITASSLFQLLKILEERETQ